MTIMKKGKTATLDNDVQVQIRRMSEQQQLRAAAIFNPKVLDNVDKKRIKNTDAIGLWKGNEAYLMFIVENACTLTSVQPTDEAWLRKIKRNALAYGIDPDDLEDDDYKVALYVRYVGMTSDAYIQAVTDIAMAVKGATAVVTKPRKQVVVEEDDDDEEEPVGVSVGTVEDEDEDN